MIQIHHCKITGVLRVLLMCASVSGLTRVGALSTDVTEVTATRDTLYVAGEMDRERGVIIEWVPGDNNASEIVPSSEITGQERFDMAIPRFERGRDRIYSSFQLAHREADGKWVPTGSRKYPNVFRGISVNTDAFPSSTSKKGLQVQMLDDALALGVRHAALNLNFSQLVQPKSKTTGEAWKTGAQIYRFNTDYVTAMDHQVKTLSDAGATVSLILLAYEGGDAEVNKVLLHPKYDRSSPNHLGAFNTVTREGAETFIATMEFLAHRYCASNYPQGRVANFILGNEVNSHWFWSNRGRCSMEEFATDYLTALRLASTAIRKASSSARAYVSLEHHWNIRYPGGDAQQAFAARPFLEFIHSRSVAEGDFEWHLAFHPYPENLFECRTWNDRTATPTNNTPRITFKNIDQLTTWLARPEWRYDPPPNESYSRRTRRVILSEQGFHCADGPEGELRQAAAYAYAYRKVAKNPGIDAFILHRHVDHAHEGGLNLGLWTHQPGSVATADRRRRMYEVFQKADQPDWASSFAFALPVIGISSWSEIETP